MSKTWRQIAAPIIHQVLEDTKGLPEKEIKKALREAYPFGQRAMHPYKIWLDEIKKQRGLKPRKAHGSNEPGPNQLKLF